jgi:hypothetical protein
VPSTNASSADANVTDVAANRAGTGPPAELDAAGLDAVGPAEVGGGTETGDTERAGVLAPVEPAAAG